MSVGHRRSILSVTFTGMVLLAILGGGGARAQQGAGSHHLWNDQLTPEQIKAALSRLSLGGQDEKDLFQKLLLEHLQKEQPTIPREMLEKAIKKFTSDPAFMEQAKKMAMEKQSDPGRAVKFNPDDVKDLVNKLPGARNGKLPFDAKNNLLPKFPNDSGKKLIDNKIDPPIPDPSINPNQPVEPKIKPRPSATPTDPGPNPPNPPGKGDNRPPSREDELFKAAEPTDARGKSLSAFAAMWERNIGPLDQTPEVKRALFDIASGTEGLDLDLQDERGNSIWDLLRKGEGDGLSFGDFMDDSGGNWRLPQVDMPSFNFGRWGGGSSSSGGRSSSGSSWWGSGDRSSSPRSSSGRGGSGGSGSFGGFGFGGSYFPLVVIGLIALGILLWVVLKNLRQTEAGYEVVADGLGPWPIDPRAINTREDVVKAFEYLSVLICGPSAKTWTHNTIADALSELATTHGETAVMLARLYELARYAPLDEPLSREELTEARQLVCGLAGVSY